MNRESFFSQLAGLSNSDIEEIIVAYWLAKDVHRGQSRDDGLRYFEHVRGVSLILILIGQRSKGVIIRSLLHDLLEDTSTPPFVIAHLFGQDTLDSLVRLSKKIPVFDERTGTVISYQKVSDEIYYERLMTAPEADRLVKCADRLHNLRSMSVWEKQRQIDYANHTKKFVLPLAQITNATLLAELVHQVNLVLQE